MPNIRFDWRWIALIIFVAILANARAVPWFVSALALGLAGGYLLQQAWRAWGISGGFGGGSRRVTYWRGQKIETGGSPRRYRPRTLSELAPVLLFALLGAALTLAALSVTIRAVAPSI
jgi:hypothetical protein